MIVYREDDETADPAECIAKLIGRAAAIGDGATEHDEIVSVLIDLGMLEAAAADRLEHPARAEAPRLRGT